MLGTLMRDFSMSEEQAMNYPTNRAFALIAFHAETQPFCKLDRVTEGYIAQEMERLKA